MGKRHISLILLIFSLVGTIYAQDQCSTSTGADGQETSTCESNYNCVGGTCVHKGLFPMSSLELTGTALIMLVTGLSNAAGSGGSTLTTLFLLMFFDYNENNAVMIAYALVFGGSLGNFMNTGFGKNPRTKKSYINYDVILVSMPSMLLGTSIGVVLNRMVAPLCITIGLVIVMYLSVGKVYKKAVKEYREEPAREDKILADRSEDESPARYLQTQTSAESMQDIEDQVVNKEYQEVLKEEYDAIPKKKMRIIISLLVTCMVLAVLKGSKKVDSILGLQYCSQEYWEMFALGIFVCLVFACFNRCYVRKINMVKKACQIPLEPGEFNITDAAISKLSRASAIAGVLAGLLGMGGGTVMSPVLLSMDASIENVVATSGFFVVQTSFMTLFQSALYGDVSLLEMLFFLAVSFIGSYGISFVLKAIIHRFKRPSIALFILVAFFVIGIIAMPAFEIWKSFSNFMEMLTFNSVC